MIAYTVKDAEQRAVVLAVNAVYVRRVEAAVAQIEIHGPMRAAVQVRDAARAMTQQEAFERLAVALKLEARRLAQRKAGRAHDAKPPLGHASVLRDGPGGVG